MQAVPIFPLDWLKDNWRPIVVTAAAITTTAITAGMASPAWSAVFTASFSAAVGGGVSGAVDAALKGGDWGQIVSGGTIGFTTGGILSMATAGLGNLIGQAPLATSKAGTPMPLANTINSDLAGGFIGTTGSVASSAVTPAFIPSGWGQDKVLGKGEMGFTTNPIKNYGGVEGLTINFDKYVDDLNGNGGVLISVEYTSPKVNSTANWSQYIKKSYPMSSSPTGRFDIDFWDGDVPSKKFQYYYTKEQIKDHISGNTIDFLDRPFKGFSDGPSEWRGLLTLYSGGKPLLRIYYGYNISGRNVIPYHPKVL